MSDPAPSALRTTALYEFHRRHGGHLVPFAGWELPLYYASILAEHRAVREHVGLFDVSHMGLLSVSGPRAHQLLGRRTTANVGRLEPGQVRYTFLLENTGRIVDDLLVSRLDRGDELVRRFLVVPNAARADEVEEILRQHRDPQTEIRRHNPQVALLAIQGPDSRRTLEGLFGWELSGLGFYRAAFFPKRKADQRSTGELGPIFPSGLSERYLLSRTGYTGELGYELFVPAEEADALAEGLVRAGVVPAGLGARDTLRLEKGYLLSGQDFHRDRSPIEAGQERFVELDHPFVGKEALAVEVKDGTAQRLSGLLVDEPGAIPRHGTPVLSDGARVAEATSGGLSPGLGRGIALAYLPTALAREGTRLEVEVRGRSAPAQVVRLPFVKASPTRG